jgi:hypothetical protein
VNQPEEQRCAQVEVEVRLRKAPGGLEFELRGRWHVLASRFQLVAQALEIDPGLTRDEVEPVIDRWLADGSPL